jgi:hypothetical protein
VATRFVAPPRLIDAHPDVVERVRGSVKLRAA